MQEKRIAVWVQRFKDRPALMLQWLDPDSGKRKSKSAKTTDEAEAEKARADLEYELNHGLHKEAARMSWEKFRETFEEEHIAGCRPGTANVFAVCFDQFEQICSPRSVRSISERTVSAFVAGLRRMPGRNGRESMAPSTIKVRLQFLHTALAWAADQKIIPVVPRFPSIKVPKKKPRPVPAESFERLLAKAPDQQMRTFLLCGWRAGLRLNEARSLEWHPSEEVPWVDLDQDRIWLPAAFVKSVEDQWIPLDPELREALLALPRRGSKVFSFVSDKTGKPIANSILTCRVIGLARRAGVKLSMHTLRKGFGCRHAGRVSAHVLQRLMRHANIKTTMDYYANIDQAVEEAILGPECNRKRNSPDQQRPGLQKRIDGGPSEATSNGQSDSFLDHPLND